MKLLRELSLRSLDILISAQIAALQYIVNNMPLEKPNEYIYNIPKLKTAISVIFLLLLILRFLIIINNIKTRSRSIKI